VRFGKEFGEGFQFPFERKTLKNEWLIDQIVYNLYGLTEEEIKIVEEHR
jgi:hypothetical protein